VRVPREFFTLLHVVMIHAVSGDSSRPLFESFVQIGLLQSGYVNSKAYRAVSSAQSKRYFARNKNWSGCAPSKSAFLPAQPKPPKTSVPIKKGVHSKPNTSSA
jgi:hypothetical protein